MGELAAKSARRRLTYGAVAFVVLALTVGLPWACSASQEAAWEANSGTQEVEVIGSRVGDGYTVDMTGRVETWDEYKETAVYVHVRRDADSPSRTPLLAAIVGDNNRCETSRSYIWSTEEGSNLTLMCDWHMSLEEIRALESVIVIGG